MKTIGIIALSGNVDRGKTESAKAYFEQKGYRVKLSKNIFAQNRYLAGTDEEKLEALYEFFSDPEIAMIMCSRGGYGAIRLVNKVDYDLIKNYPKIFCGYSDVTALLLMIYKRTGIITYHGPMACTDFCENVSSFTKENFLKALNGKMLEFSGDKIYKFGNAEGIIWGGNLSTTVSLCGLDFVPDEDFIFLAEDLNEPVYKIDKMFQQLINIDKFREYCKGIVLGDFLNCGNEEWLENYFKELAEHLNITITGGFKITHERDKITIPVGRKCEVYYGKTPVLIIK